jgi:hypothetical protein
MTVRGYKVKRRKTSWPFFVARLYRERPHDAPAGADLQWKEPEQLLKEF